MVVGGCWEGGGGGLEEGESSISILKESALELNEES